MPLAAFAALPRPLPARVVAEQTSAGVRVTFRAERVSLLSHSVWKAGLLRALHVGVFVGAFLALIGFRRVTPLVWVLYAGGSVLAGLYWAVITRTSLAMRLSGPAVLELTADILSIDEPGFRFKISFWSAGRRKPDVVPMHRDYSLSDMSDVSIAGYWTTGTNAVDFAPYGTAAPGAIAITLTNRATNIHLRGRSVDQRRWACQWLSQVERAAKMKRGDSPDAPRPVDRKAEEASFVYDQGGLHRS